MVKELILFIASNSRASAPTFSIVQRNRLPVDVVRLDTPESRQRAMRGKDFQVTDVPTLLVVHDNGSFEPISGANRVNFWLTETFLSPKQEEPQPEILQEEPIEEARVEEIEDEPKRSRVRPRKKDPPVDFESIDQPVEESIHDQPVKKVSSRMSDIANVAKRLEEERKASLGYEEAKLPKF